MSTGGFKFDFSPKDDSAVSDPSAADAQNRLISDANELISKLMERSERNAGSCTLVDASSRIFAPGDTNDEDSKRVEHDFKPHLRFQPHESIDLRSARSEVGDLRHVIPKHTISDDSSDLIPGVYEGGLKVWECSIDLCRFLAGVIDNLSEDSSVSSTDADGLLLSAVRISLGAGGSTLELGCGHGLPGCLVLRENIRRTSESNNSVVIFSDFNDFVLHHATIPNAQLNVCGLRGEDGVAIDECRTAKALVNRSVFAGGDWMGLSRKLSSGNLPYQEQGKDNRLDLILASETTYTAESCQDTAFLLLRHLKIGGGIGLVATKRFYFGVGGGTDLFKQACETLSMCDVGPLSDLRLAVRVVQSYDTGNANIRDLLEVKCQRK